jgi:hypothetical protein
MSYSKSRNLPRVLIAVAVLAIGLVALMMSRNSVSGAATVAPLPGAVFTTTFGCDNTNVNIYANKDAVYLDGGPAHPGAAGLPDGSYYVRVTEPDGTLLGTSVGSGNDTPVVVLNGEFGGCLQLSAILIKASDATPGYDTTSNPGGEYKVWVSQVSTFDNDSTKTDNFKVKPVADCPEPPCDTPPQGTLNVIKYYDANANGINDDGLPIVGWKVLIQDGIDLVRFTPASVVVDPGDYIVTECDPVETNWAHTTPSIVSPATVVNGGTTTVEFGNVCLGAGGGLTLGFWSNKNGLALANADDYVLLSGLCLRNANGSNFDPNNDNGFRTWILSANASNMAYMLSAQLAAMELNVFNGNVNGNSIIAVPNATGVFPSGFATVNAVMAAANAALCADGVTLSGDPNRSLQEALKTALDKANNNQNFVQSGPCPFTSFVCPN